MKALVHPEDIVCAHAARKLARPVRWRSTRLEEFQASSHGRDQRAEAELALDRDGRILALRVRITGSIGAYGHAAGGVIHLAIGPLVTTGVYHVPVLDLQAKAVLTHTNVIGAYRGAGRPEAIYLIERLMDRAAAQLKMDPAELRRRNLVRPEQMPYRNAMGETYDSGNFQNLLDRALAAADWAGFDERKRASQARGRLRGRAVSTFLEWTGALAHEETVRLHVEGDGRVRVFTAMQAMGQGIETSYLQILAETLQLDPGRIEIVHGDSDVAQGIGSMGSRARSTSAARRCRPRHSRRSMRGARWPPGRLRRRPRILSTPKGATRSSVPTSASIWLHWRSGSPNGASPLRRCKRSADRPGRTAATSVRSRSNPRPGKLRSCATRRLMTSAV